VADDLDDILEVGRRKRSPPLRAGSDFPALQIIAGIHKVIAVIAFVLGVIGVLLLVPLANNGMAVVAAVAWTLLVPLFLWGSGELILVFLRIEQNTRPDP